MAQPFRSLFQLVCITFLLAVWLTAPAAQAKEPMSQQQALRTLNHSDPQQRFEAMNRLAVIGTADAADAVLARLHDKEPGLRNVALGTVWQMWGRTGDKEIDTLYSDGTAEMKEGNVLEAIRIFSDIITKRPAFAEAWNKRATLYFMVGQFELSMQDCEEVLKRVPKHFGALSGYAQMLAERDQPEKALELMQRAVVVNPNMANAELLMADLRRRIEIKRKQMV
jgi:tetratricopeptide (TPR) repeat protein